MQKRHMAGVNLAFDVLQIIAVLKTLVHVDVTLWKQRPLELQLAPASPLQFMYAQIVPPASCVGYAVWRIFSLKPHSAGSFGISMHAPFTSNFQP